MLAYLTLVRSAYSCESGKSMLDVTWDAIDEAITDSDWSHLIIRKDKDSLTEALYMLSIIRKLERVGDQSKNIAEEIIFYVEAKILKHLESSKRKLEGEE